MLSLVAGLVGYAVGAGILLAPSMPEFTPPTPVDLARFEAEARGQLRGIDPDAPGAFERATAVLARVNQQLSMYSPWGPGSTTTSDRVLRRVCSSCRRSSPRRHGPRR
ncbi:MAG TPA: hypothetical protein VFP66_04670 [Candidatus Limnocylindrales bacterium]|nr:hypothetical protein [Candidatus Limnocylindrales bacterium]